MRAIYPNKFAVDISGMIFLLEAVSIAFCIEEKVFKLTFLRGSNIDFSLPSDNLSLTNYSIFFFPVSLALVRSSRTSGVATIPFEIHNRGLSVKGEINVCMKTSTTVSTSLIYFLIRPSVRSVWGQDLL